MKIGFIGLGIMGSRMAANLLKRGYELIVHNRTQHHAEPLLASGATWGANPAAVGEQADVLITVLAHPEALAAMALGPAGFLGRLRAGAVWMDHSTVNPSFAREMAAAAGERGVRCLDAPIGGSKDAAANGELQFFVGGEPEDLAECRPLLDAMGSRVLHVGGHGMGAALKLVNNLIVAQAVAASAEALILGESLGLSREALFEILGGRGVLSPFLIAKRVKIETGDYEPDFALRWMRKDLHLAALTAYEQGVALPLGNAAKELYAHAVRHGLGEADFSAIYAFLNADESVGLPR